MALKRRALVLQDEAVAHPFRRSLPPHVLSVAGEGGPPRRRRISMTAIREFLMAYCAMFAAISAFIA